MTDVEVRVGAILERIVDLSVMEIGKIVGVSNSGQPEESACSAETAQRSPSETVGKNEQMASAHGVDDVDVPHLCVYGSA